MQRHDSAVIERHLMTVIRFEAIGITLGEQFLRQCGVAGNTGLLDTQPRLDGTVVMFRPANAEGPDMIEEKIDPVFGRQRQHHIRLAGGKACRIFSKAANNLSFCSAGAASVQAVMPGAWLAPVA